MAEDKAKPGELFTSHPLMGDDEVESQLATEGTGPLLERDYEVRIEGSPWTPAEAIEAVLRDFPSFSEAKLALFHRRDGRSGPLRVGEVMDVRIRGTGWSQVRITDVDERTFTMRTVEGHPEAGRITFGADCGGDGGLVFRIRSRARQGNLVTFIGFLLGGKKLQEHIWKVFLDRVVEASGGRKVGEIRVCDREVPEAPADAGEVEEPTFVAAGSAGDADGE